MFGISRSAIIVVGALMFLSVLAGVGLGYIFRERLVEIRVDVGRLLSPGDWYPRLTDEARFADSAPGLTMAEGRSDDGHLLLSAYFMDVGRSEVRLISLADGTVQRTWRPDKEAVHDLLTLDPSTDEFRAHNPLIMDDGGLAFVIYGEGLVRVDACGEVVWARDVRAHHSLNFDLDGNLITPGWMDAMPHPLDLWNQHDAIWRYDLDGNLLEEISLYDLLSRHGHRALMLSNYPNEIDPLHLNDLEVATEDGPFWQRGDIMMSLRNISTVAIWRPSTDEMVWFQTGPWLRHHDPDFLPDGRISVYGNDVIHGNRRALPDGMSEIYIVNADGSVETPFTEVLAEMEFKEYREGIADYAGPDSFVIEETVSARISRIDRDGVVWSYNNHDGARSGILSWSRYIPAGSLPAGAARTCDEG